jgi:hypothetical protein
MTNKQPFFAQFIEAQELSNEETLNVSGGRRRPPIFVTLKYPSDDDEGGMVTLKYPSDDDEGIMVTLKYPSDNDEG